MSTAVWTGRLGEASPRFRARMTGFVYLLYFVTAVLGEFFLRGLVVDGDAAATANNLAAPLASENLAALPPGFP